MAGPEEEQNKKVADHSMVPWIYDTIVWTLSVLIDLFFREVHPRNSWKFPKSGPVIFVAAPHANQFVDSLILMRMLLIHARRRVSWLIAAKSMERGFIGSAARLVGAIPVGRALDKQHAVPGRIYLPDPDNDPTLVRGVDTNFESKEFQVGGLVVLPSVNNTAANAEIIEIMGPEELRVKNPFKGSTAYRQLTGKSQEKAAANDDKEASNGHVRSNGDSKTSKSGSPEEFEGTHFKVAPKVDQSQVYEEVFAQLKKGGCIGIFPEGGSHDRTELLPLKPGVAIMALGAKASDPNCNVKIVPCGMNYFHAHKFRSRAVVEFGPPIDVPPELVEQYQNGSRREAIGKLLEIVHNALVAVTVTAPDYETLMLIQAVRRLYNPKGKPLPLSIVVELNRRLVKGYQKYKDDPRIVSIRKSVIGYNKQLLALNIRDHQLEYAKLSIFQVLATLLYRLGKILLLSAGVLPGLLLFAPVFAAGKIISIRKSREALAASSVKVQARDVVATWKLLVSLALAPALYTWYTVILTWWTYNNNVQGYVPKGTPLWLVVLFGFMFFPTITYAALRFGEIGMDIFKSLRPLVLSLNPTGNNPLIKLRQRRAQLATEVTNLINELGPEMFPDFDSKRLIAATARHSDEAADVHPDTPARANWSDIFTVSKSGDESPAHNYEGISSFAGGSKYAGQLPHNESYANLANIGLFASRPHSPGRSRSASRSHSRPGSSSGFGNNPFAGASGFSTLDSKEAQAEVSKKIRGAMKERNERRGTLGGSSTVEDGDDSRSEGASSGVITPAAASDNLSMTKKNR